MRRAALLLGVVMSVAGCRAAAERVALQPLPDDAGTMPFVDLVARARLQAMAANEAFYVDHWKDLEDAAAGLKQTAQFLKRARAVPSYRQADLPSRADNLARDAEQLRDAGRRHEVDQVNAVLQRIHFQVRELRSER